MSFSKTDMKDDSISGWSRPRAVITEAAILSGNKSKFNVLKYRNLNRFELESHNLPKSHAKMTDTKECKNDN